MAKPADERTQFEIAFLETCHQQQQRKGKVEKVRRTRLELISRGYPPEEAGELAKFSHLNSIPSTSQRFSSFVLGASESSQADHPGESLMSGGDGSYSEAVLPNRDDASFSERESENVSMTSPHCSNRNLPSRLNPAPLLLLPRPVPNLVEFQQAQLYHPPITPLDATSGLIPYSLFSPHPSSFLHRQVLTQSPFAAQALAPFTASPAPKTESGRQAANEVCGEKGKEVSQKVEDTIRIVVPPPLTQAERRGIKTEEH
jgi:hypothetical protein